MSRSLLFAALLLGATLPTLALAELPPSMQSTSVTLSGVEDAQWTLGTPGQLAIEVRHPRHVAVHFPKRPHLGRHLRLVGHRSTREESDDGIVTTRHALDVLPLRPGRQSLAAIEIALVAGSDASTTSTPGATLAVARNLVNETSLELRSQGSAQEIEVTNKPLLHSLIALAAALLGALIAFFAIRFLGPALRRAPRVPPPRPAHVIALERLESLRQSPWIDSGEFEAWFGQLTDIIREYFANRYRMLALGETTTELIEQLDARAPAGLDRAAVAALLAEADLIKFARQESARSAAEEALGTMTSIVEATRQRETDEDTDPIPDWEPPPPAPKRLRAAAFLIDLVALGAAAGALFLLPLPNEVATAIGWIWLGTLSLLLLLRDLLGRSPGKRVMRLELVEE